MKAPSTGLSTHAHVGTQLPGALSPASSPVHPLEGGTAPCFSELHTAPGGPLACIIARPPSGGGTAPCFSELELQQLRSCDHTLLSDLLRPERSLGKTSTSFRAGAGSPGALGPWGWGSPLHQGRPWARDLGWYESKALSPSRGVRLGCREWAGGPGPGRGEPAGCLGHAVGPGLLPHLMADRPLSPSSGEETEALGGTALPVSLSPTLQCVGEEVVSRPHGSHSPGAAGRQRVPQQ